MHTNISLLIVYFMDLKESAGGRATPTLRSAQTFTFINVSKGRNKEHFRRQILLYYINIRPETSQQIDTYKTKGLSL